MSASSRGPRILLVEDLPGELDLVRMRLVDFDGHVYTNWSCESPESIRDANFDLLSWWWCHHSANDRAQQR